MGVIDENTLNEFGYIINIGLNIYILAKEL